MVIFILKTHKHDVWESLKEWIKLKCQYNVHHLILSFRRQTYLYPNTFSPLVTNKIRVGGNGMGIKGPALFCYCCMKRLIVLFLFLMAFIFQLYLLFLPQFSSREGWQKGGHIKYSFSDVKGYLFYVVLCFIIQWFKLL